MLGWYLNFFVLFMKNMSIIWTEMGKILENEADIMQHVLKIGKFSCA
jgi:hypothetical protein